jgi:TRAP-type uncharacterized transport system substrate-binding protein
VTKPRLLAIVAVIAIIAIIGMIAGNPFPPRSITMVTGPDGGAFAEYGERYRGLLAEAGVEVRLVQTEGGETNLQRLGDKASGAVVGLVEGGLASLDSAPGVVSLGTVTLEPFWLFVRAGRAFTRPADLIGARIALEPRGSGANVMARRLLASNGISDTSVAFREMSPLDGAEALLRGEVDAAAILTAWRSSAVQRLLVSDSVVVAGYPRADAYLARSPFLYKVILPQGTADLAKNRPATDVPLLAVVASLVVREDLHPALQYALLEAAARIHGGPDAFHRPGRFPAAEAIDLPLSPQAQTYYQSGRPFVYSYLPLWLAGPIERLLIILLPLLVVILPIVQVVPKIYAYLTEHRIFGLYGELRELEARMEGLDAGPEAEELARSLDELERRASNLRIPTHYQQRRFILKEHIARARERAGSP